MSRFPIDVTQRSPGDPAFDYDRDIQEGTVSILIVHHGQEDDPTMVVCHPVTWRRRVAVMAACPAPEETGAASLLEFAQRPEWEAGWYDAMRAVALDQVHSKDLDVADMGISLLAFVLCHQPGATVDVEQRAVDSVEKFGKAVIVLACRRCEHGSILIRTIADRCYRADLVAEWFARTDCGDQPPENVAAPASSVTLH